MGIRPENSLELNQIKQSLDAQKALMRHAELVSGFGTWELDLKTNELTWSDGVFLICEFEPQSFEVTFERGLGVIHPDDQAIAIQAMQDTMNTGKEYKIQKRFQLENGKIKHILSRGSLIKNPDGEPAKLIGVFQDITEGIENERKIQETLDNYQTLIENVDGIIWEADANTFEFSFVSPQVQRILGYSPEEWLQEKEFWLNHIHPEDRDYAYSFCKSNIENGKDHTFEYRMQKKSGEYILLQDRVAVLKSKGKSNRLKGILVDINSSFFNQKLEQMERSVMEKSMEVEATLEEVLTLQMRKLEEIFPEMKASTLKVKNEKIYNLASPSLSAEYLQSITGQPIGPRAGSCGTAAFLQEEVIVSDVSTDPRWENYSHLGKLYGFQACWSRPIFNKQGEVVATFANYYNEKREPRSIEKIAINRAHRLASLILERYSDLAQIKHINELNAFIYRATNEAVYEWDIKEDSVNWGESFERFFGYKHNGIFTSQDWNALIHPDDFDEVSKDIAEFMDNPEMSKLEKGHRLLKKDGSIAFVEVIGFLIRNESGEPIRMIGILRDVTETKELKRLLDSASVMAKIGGWEVDIKTGKNNWSKMTKAIHEVPEELEIDLDLAINFYREDVRDKVKELVNNSIETGEPFDFELPIITYLGNEKWVRAIGHADFYKGKCTRIYGSFQDITERKVSEYQIEEQIKALAKSNQELEQFAYVASHDLQEPLRMVTSFLALIEKKYGPLFDTKGKTYIEYAMDGAVRMRRIILDLLDFSRVGRNEEAPVKIDLMAVIEDVKKLQKQAIEENHAIIETDNLPQVIATKLSVEQVFNNLIGNALKYRKPDINPEIKISANDIGKFWEIAVSDNGIGIEKEYFDKVFVIFQRLHTKEEYSGTGIGLAIVKKIIDNLGGKIWLESEVGKGSTFYFTLPK